MKSHTKLLISHEKNAKVKIIMKWIIVSGCKAEAFCSARVFGAVAGQTSSPLPPPITIGLAIKLQYDCVYIIDVETAISIMPQTFYTFEVCGYRVIIPYNTFPSLGCAGCHKKMFLWKFQATGVMSIVTLNTFFFICALPAFWGFALIKRARLSENELSRATRTCRSGWYFHLLICMLFPGWWC